MPASPAVNGRNDRFKNKSKVIVLKVSSQGLSRFVPKSEPKSSSSAASTPLNGTDETPNLKSIAMNDNISETNSTPAPGQDVSTPGEGSKKRKGLGGPRKSLNTGIDTMPKPRGKPGPKKKPRLEDGTIDHSAKPAAVGTAAHKLGPKANTGAINAGLRALDRTGTPCRKWAKRGFQLKSFTGIVWELPSWKGGDNSMLARSHSAESISENKDISMQSSSDMKPNGSDVATSNVGDQADSMLISTPAPSSPAPILASAAVAAHG